VADPPLWVPDHARQVRFHEQLVFARRTWLMDALSNALGGISPRVLKEQLVSYVPDDVQRLLAIAGIRDEQVFPAPIVLEAAPTLVAYYRLLLGVPQKTFYGGRTGMSRFRSMEVAGTINPRQREALPEFCMAMGAALAELVRQISPRVTSRDIAELPLLTLGSQIQGGQNNLIGQKATKDIFLVMAEVLEGHIDLEHSASELTVQNSQGETVFVTLASDPDVTVHRRVVGEVQNNLAIEIKGGEDRSNAHNRAGEAEKSHGTAKRNHYARCWTIFALTGLDVDKIKRESPSTDEWFDLGQVLAREGPDFARFRRRLLEVIGL